MAVEERITITEFCSRDIVTCTPGASGCSRPWTQGSECSVASLIGSSSDGILSLPTSSRAHDLLVDEGAVLFNHLNYYMCLKVPVLNSCRWSLGLYVCVFFFFFYLATAICPSPQREKQSHWSRNFSRHFSNEIFRALFFFSPKTLCSIFHNVLEISVLKEEVEINQYIIWYEFFRGKITHLLIVLSLHHHLLSLHRHHHGQAP